MKKIEHRYFGQPNLDITDDMEVVWKKEVQGIDTCLWLGKKAEANADILDFYANFLKNISEKIKEARKALVDYLSKDSYYIDFHIKELGLEDVPGDITGFVTKMCVTNLALWIDGKKPHITMDFMISPDESDEILCVKFDENANIIAVDWES